MFLYYFRLYVRSVGSTRRTATDNLSGYAKYVVKIEKYVFFCFLIDLWILPDFYRVVARGQLKLLPKFSWFQLFRDHFSVFFPYIHLCIHLLHFIVFTCVSKQTELLIGTHLLYDNNNLHFAGPLETSRVRLKPLQFLPVHNSPYMMTKWLMHTIAGDKKGSTVQGPYSQSILNKS